MDKLDYFSIQLKCFEWSGIFLNFKSQRLESLAFCIKLPCMFFTIVCHGLFCYRNLDDLFATTESFGMFIVLVNGLINFYILIRHRERILKIKKNIESLTVFNNEVNDKSLQRLQNFEKKSLLIILVLLVLFFIGSYSSSIMLSTFEASMGRDFNFDFPVKVSFPYEVDSIPIYLASYVVVFFGTFSVIFLGVSSESSSFTLF